MERPSARLSGQQVTGHTWLAFLQIVFALLLWRPGRGTVWPIPVATVIVAAVVIQIGAGFQGRPALHIPLGVAILGANLALAILLRRPREGDRRFGNAQRPCADHWLS